MEGPPETGGRELFVFIGLPEAVIKKLSARVPSTMDVEALFLRTRDPQRLKLSDSKAAIKVQEILFSKKGQARRRVVVQLPYPRMGPKLKEVVRKIREDGQAEVRRGTMEDGWPNLLGCPSVGADELDALLACAVATCGVSELPVTVVGSSDSHPFSAEGEETYAYEFLRGLFSHDKFSENKHSPLDTCRGAYPNLPRGRKRRVERLMRQYRVIDSKFNDGQKVVWVADAPLAERWFPKLRTFNQERQRP